MRQNLKNIGEELKETLVDLGLSETETKVFTFLVLQDVGLRATEIALRTHLNRTTLYGVLKALVSRGLISMSELRGVQVFQAIQPHLLVDYIERTREKLASNIKRVRDMVPTMNSIRTNQEGYRPLIKFYDGTEGIKQVYEELMVNNKEKLIYGFTGAQAAWQLMSMDWIEYIFKKRPAMGVHWLAISVDSPVMREAATHDKEHLRTTRFLPAHYHFDVELAAYDDKTLIMSFASEHPLAIQITDKNIAETVKSLFRYVDDTLKAKPTP